MKLGNHNVVKLDTLSIETLMVVFKIALDDYKNLSSAFYLMVGTTMLFVSLGYFYKTINAASCKEVE